MNIFAYFHLGSIIIFTTMIIIYTNGGISMNKKCKDCGLDVDILLNTIETMNGEYTYCQNHIVLRGINGFDFEFTPNTKCEICGNDGVIFRNSDGEYHLCKSHLEDFLRLNLSPEDFFKLLESHSATEFMLHDDFYDPQTGYAFQPR